MSEFYRIVSLPAKWPAGEQLPMPKRPKAPFTAGWTDTIQLLESEVRALRGRDVTLALDVQASDLNRQGGIRADARVRNSSVVLQLTAGADRLTFPCDAFDWWQSNVRALGLALGDLRRVNRYRVHAGRQYEGFKALPPGGGATPAMTIDEAGQVIAQAAGAQFSVWEITNAAARAELAVRAAAAATHPDREGGNQAAFQRVQSARAVLTAHFGEDV